MSLEKKVGGDPRRGAAMPERHPRRGHEAPAGQPEFAVVAGGRGLVARGLISAEAI